LATLADRCARWEILVHKVRVFWNLDWRERLLLVEALAVVVAVRLGLWLLPFQKLRSLVRAAGRCPVDSHSANVLPVERIAWTVRAVGDFVPGATCLTQALAGQIMLARRSQPARLHIGVAKGSEEKLSAHAWLECDGRIVLGDHGYLSAYAPFPTLE
jgi:hypothetical protein